MVFIAQVSAIYYRKSCRRPPFIERISTDFHMDFSLLARNHLKISRETGRVKIPELLILTDRASSWGSDRQHHFLIRS